MGETTLELSDLNGYNGFTIKGKTAGDLSGYFVTGVGDINDDQVDDICVFAPQANIQGVIQPAAYFIFGQPNIGISDSLYLNAIDGTNGFILTGLANNNNTPIQAAGDVNQDNIADLIAINHRGQATVLYGHRMIGNTGRLDVSNIDGSQGFIVTGLEQSHRLSVNSLGDINGDNISDIFISAFTLSTNSTAYVIFGASHLGETGYVDVRKLNGTQGYRLNAFFDQEEYRGFVGNSAGDMNHDGYPDACITHYTHQADNTYILYGAEAFADTIDLSLLNGDDGFIIRQPADLNTTQMTVQYIGDINADGTADIAFGYPYADANNKKESGSVTIFTCSSERFTDEPSMIPSAEPSAIPSYKPTPKRAVSDLPLDYEVYIPLDGDSLDYSGHEHHGTAVGQLTPAPDRFLRDGLSYHFDGSSYVYGSSNGFSAEKHTVSFWIKFDMLTTPSGQGMTCFGISGGPCGTNFLLHFNNAKYYSGAYNIYEAQGSCDANYFAYSTNTNPTQSWLHWAVVTDDLTNKMYINGSLVVNANMSNMMEVTNHLFSLGARVMVTDDTYLAYSGIDIAPLHGYLDEFLFYNRPLNGTEIAAIFSNQPPVLQNNQFNITDTEPFVITPNMLSATDISPAQEENLEFTIANLTNGHFEHQEAPSISIKKFSQYDVTHGFIYFFPGNPKNQTSFTIQLSDGILWTQPVPANIILVTYSPTAYPSRQPSVRPTMQPSALPSLTPTAFPSLRPSFFPSICPTMQPSMLPSLFPTRIPSTSPTYWPSSAPTYWPSTWPTLQPSAAPSLTPTAFPSLRTSFFPSIWPTMQPSMLPSLFPTRIPSTSLTYWPSFVPTFSPSSDNPTSTPSSTPSSKPSGFPTLFSSKQPSSTHNTYINDLYLVNGVIELNRLCTLDNDGIVVVGSVILPSDNYSGRKIIIFQEDNQGKQAWSVLINQPGESIGTDVIALSSPNREDIVVAGYSSSFGANNNDLLLVTLTGAGDVTQIKTFSSICDDKGLRLIETRKEELVIVGSSTCSTSGKNTAGLIMKLDRSGNEQWIQRYEDADFHQAFLDVTEDVYGNFYAVGYAYDNTEENAALLKVNNQGDIISSHRFVKPGTQRGVGIVLISFNRFIIALSDTTKKQAMMMLCNHAGQLYRQISFYSGVGIVPSGLTKDVLGNLLLIGSYLGEHNSSAIFLSRLSQHLQFDWTRIIRVKNSSLGKAITTDASGNIFSLGQTSTLYRGSITSRWSDDGNSVGCSEVQDITPIEVTSSLAVNVSNASIELLHMNALLRTIKVKKESIFDTNQLCLFKPDKSTSMDSSLGWVEKDRVLIPLTCGLALLFICSLTIIVYYQKQKGLYAKHLGGYDMPVDQHEDQTSNPGSHNTGVSIELTNRNTGHDLGSDSSCSTLHANEKNYREQSRSVCTVS